MERFKAAYIIKCFDTYTQEKEANGFLFCSI